MSKLKKEATHGYVGGPTYHKITDEQTGVTVAVNVREGYAELFEKSPELQEQVVELVAALEEIAKGEGEYSHDRLTHASNAVESMKEIAKAALAKHQPKPQEEN